MTLSFQTRPARRPRTKSGPSPSSPPRPSGWSRASSCRVWIRGEVVELQGVASGHWYFTLRDASSQVRCCMWQPVRQRAGKPPADGTEVFVLGAPGLYEAKGEFQLSVTRMLPTAAIGAGAAGARAGEGSCSTSDGLFDPARKRPLPALAATRRGGHQHRRRRAARHHHRGRASAGPACRLVVVDARVQGDGAVRRAGARARAGEPDRRTSSCCIVGRGGGGREDLAAFNSEAVCRALAAVRVPTISAVGHETDISLTDLVADVRAATPSAAAELARRRPPRGRPRARRPRRPPRAAASAAAPGSARERLARTADRLAGARSRRVLERRAPPRSTGSAPSSTR